MNLFKKSFVLVSILFVFVLGLSLISSSKADATLAVPVAANGVANSLSVAYGTLVTITWNASSATSCSNNFNSSTATSGNYIYTATSTRTFTVNCVSCNGYQVAGSRQCNGAVGPGPDEGLLCSTFKTQQTCVPSSCNSWFHHGCYW